jgi:hypothetical protein
MGKVRLRFLSFRIETFGLVHKHLTHCYVTVAELRMWITRVLRPQPRAAGVLAVLLLFIGFIHPVVADAVTINALLELDLRDWSSIYSVKVIDQCTSALRDHTNLSEDQVCRLHILKAVAHDLN